MTAAILIQNRWQVGLAMLGVVVFIIVRHAIRSAREKRAQTEELLSEWETYQRRQGQ